MDPIARARRSSGKRMIRQARRGLLFFCLVGVLQGSSCPEDDQLAAMTLTPEASGDRILAAPSPLVVAQGETGQVALEFRSPRSDPGFSGFRIPADRDTDVLSLRIDESRRSEATPLLADLIVDTAAAPPGLYRVGVESDVVEVDPNLLRSIDVVVVPRDMASLPAVAEADAGDFHSIALLEDGSVWTWGRNADGQLGDGTFVDRLQPVSVQELPGRATRVSAGGAFSMVLLEDGSVWSWGANDFRQLGAEDVLDARERVATPAPLACRDFRCDPLPRFVEISAGTEHALALTDAGVVWAWGRFAFGALGRETNDRESGIPFPVGFPNDLSGIVDFVAISAGDGYSLALEDDGRVWGWGDNRLAQLGDDFDREYEFPIELLGLGPGSAVAISAGADHALVLTPDGRVLSAGSNGLGRLGDPAREGPRFQPIPLLSNVVDIAAGGTHSVALRANGSADAWGSNVFDQLGFPERTPPSIQPTPVLVQGVPPLVDVAAGGRHALGLARDCPGLWAWGDNVAGQLGLGNTLANGFPGRTRGIGEASALSGTAGCGLPLTVAIAGAGTVRADAGRIDCPAELCSETYLRDQTVRLTATPAENERFLGWSGAVSGATSPIDVRVSTATSVVARFESIREAPVADFSITPPSPAPPGAFVFDAGASFDPDGEIVAWDWSSPGRLLFEGSGPTFEFEFPFAGTYEIVLVVTDDDGLVSELRRPLEVVRGDPGGGDPEPTFDLDVTFLGPGSGRVQQIGAGAAVCTTSCTLAVPAGEPLSFQGVADEGSFFSNFVGCDPDPGAGFDVCPLTLTADRSISIFFE